MELVELGASDPMAYRGIVADELLNEVYDLGNQLRGLRVVNVNATAGGGGVVEILRAFVPLMRGAGLDMDWYAMDPDPAFFAVTKKIHNLLQGAPGDLTAAEKLIYLKHNERLAHQLRAIAADVWVVHDPQPLPVVADEPCINPAIWCCHIDTSTPNAAVRDFLLPFVQRYEQVIFSLPEFALAGLESARLNVITPAIAALVIKNAPLERTFARRVVYTFGPVPDRPLVTQASRFDPWKDPIGVVDAYRLARQEVPGLQLALLGAAAKDDPESVRVLAEVEQHVAGDPDIYLLTERNRLTDFDVNAFQTASDVVVQKSLREGFGLTVSEAMWKGQPVVGGNVGGIRTQICDGQDGFLVSSVPECAEKIVLLLQDRARWADMGDRARKHVRADFLMPRLMLDYLQLFARVTQPTGVR
jgi:trehalose synthase